MALSFLSRHLPIIFMLEPEAVEHGWLACGQIGFRIVLYIHNLFMFDNWYFGPIRYQRSLGIFRPNVLSFRQYTFSIVCLNIRQDTLLFPAGIIVNFCSFYCSNWQLRLYVFPRGEHYVGGFVIFASSVLSFLFFFFLFPQGLNFTILLSNRTLCLFMIEQQWVETSIKFLLAGNFYSN